MPQDENKKSMTQVISAFAEKMNRFKNADEENRSVLKTVQESSIAEKIAVKEEQFSKSVCKKYELYKNAEHLANENNGSEVSKTASVLWQDEQNLLAAYNLFKAVKEAESQFGSEHTCLKKDILVSSLVNKAEYTAGEDFAYLRAWLFFERKAKDFVPQFQKNQDGTFSLQFVPARHAQNTLSWQEITSIIKEHFYRGE